MDINFIREAVTVISFAAFIAIVAWAVHPGNRSRFEEAARLPVEDGNG
jgi:cytochrome c oxidase cbb3-type subunit 4